MIAISMWVKQHIMNHPPVYVYHSQISDNTFFLFYPHDELFQPAPAHEPMRRRRSPLLSSQTLASASISPFLRRALELSIDKAPSRSTPQTAVVMLKSPMDHRRSPLGINIIKQGNGIALLYIPHFDSFVWWNWNFVVSVPFFFFFTTDSYCGWLRNPAAVGW